jgi:hypothetical protein
MFYDTLPWTGLMLAAAFVATRQRPPASFRWACFLLFGLVAAALGGCEVTFGQFFLLFIAVLVWTAERDRVRWALPLLLVAVAIPYGFVGLSARRLDAEHDRLREKYTFESLTGRIHEPNGALRVPPTGAAASRFDEMTAILAGYARYDGTASRGFQFRRLHERTVRTFVNNPGFGVRRVAFAPHTVHENVLKGDRDDYGPTPDQPGSPVVWRNGEPFEPTREPGRDVLVGIHSAGTLDFVNPWGWGYVRSRREVVGFLPHRFSKVPDADKWYEIRRDLLRVENAFDRTRANAWQVQRIELVGLLKHPEPVAYLSDKLPAMDELRGAPTRPLDEFETSALGVIRKGDDGFAARRSDVVRFVGAIRSAEQCVQCHGGERGDLLGAFSYTLRKDGAR